MCLGNFVGIQIMVLRDANQVDEIRALAAKYAGQEKYPRALSKVEGFVADTESGKAMLLIADGGYHPEGIKAFNDELARSCKRSKEFLGVALSREPEERNKDETQVVIFGLRTDSIEGLEKFLRVPGMDGVLRCFVSPVQYEANVICTPESLQALGRKIGGERISSSGKATTFHRAWTEQQQHPVREEKRHGRYDVVWAQINEATINTAAYLRERVASLEKSIGTEVSRSRDLIDLRLPLATFRHNLDMLLGDVRSYKERARQRSAFKVSESGTVDVISNYVRHAEKPIVVLEPLFEQRRSEAVQQSGMATDAALLALDGVTHFCGNLIEETHGTTPAHRRQWAVLLGRKVSFIDAPEFRGVLPINMSWTAPGASFSISEPEQARKVRTSASSSSRGSGYCGVARSL